MSNESTTLMRHANKSIEVKSLKDLVRARSNENPVLLVDVSTSMNAPMRNSKTRIQGLREVVAQMQSQRPTSMIAFGLDPHRQQYDNTGLEQMPTLSQVGFVTEVPDAQGGTPMAEGIEFARVSGFGRAVVISDGAPNDPNAAMEAARQFGGRIDVVYVGDPGDPGSVFLDRLAQATGGTRFEGDLTETKELASAVVGLLAGAEMEEEDDDEEDEEDDEEDDDEDDDEEDEK